MHSLLRHISNLLKQGEMVEWSITVVLKTTVPRGTGGSNPSLSAKKSCKSLIYRTFSFQHRQRFRWRFRYHFYDYLRVQILISPEIPLFGAFVSTAISIP